MNGQSSSDPIAKQSPKEGNPFLLRASRKCAAAFSIVEVAVASGLVLIAAVASTQAMLSANRLAAANRVMTAGRVIVQRNIDTALSLRFDSTVTPAVLAITSSSGVNYDDDAVVDGTVNILTQKNSSGAEVPLVKGTLRRTVTAIANTPGADIRRITFRLNYVFERRNYVIEMAAVRAIDD